MSDTTTSAGAPLRTAVGDGEVYFRGGHPDALYAVAKAGGAPRRITYLGSTQTDVWAWDFAVDASVLYVMSYGRNDVSASNGGVVFYPKSGASAYFVEAAAQPCRAAFLQRIAVAEGDVYYAQDNSRTVDPSVCPSSPASPQIGRIAVGARMPSIVADESASTHSARGIFADHSHVFWSDDAGVWRLARDGSGSRQQLAIFGDSWSMASDGNSLFVIRPDGVWAISAPLVANRIFEGKIFDLTSDAQHVYVATDLGVTRFDADGGNVALLTPVPSGGVVLDDTYVYFSTNGTIAKACK